MTGFCPTCKVIVEDLHRGAFIVQTPRCEKCGMALHPTKETRRVMRSRVLEMIQHSKGEGG